VEPGLGQEASGETGAKEREEAVSRGFRKGPGVGNMQSEKRPRVSLMNKE
jgi:hypothetical protein